MTDVWMTNLPPEISRRPLNRIVIPGSHDSCADVLFAEYPVANDATSTIHRFGRMPFGRQVIRRWALTQRLNVYDQLQSGIRYFDMRVSVPDCPFVKGMRVLHALYGRTLEHILREMQDFLNTHPKEIIILDFNHFYNFDNDSSAEFLKMLEMIFGLDSFCPKCEGYEVSLEFMWKNRYQIIVISSNLFCFEGASWIWRPDTITSPYPNVNRLDLLFKALEEALEHRKFSSNGFFVTQAILTARIRDVCLHPFSSLEETFARKCTQQTISWISNYVKPSFFNIIICDFIEVGNYCEAVIALNF
uniref:PLCXc domain-containing protein n=1 Tax=Syphacia muris TaxID=451379 RepID=A0A0N5AVE4_9BILA